MGRDASGVRADSWRRRLVDVLVAAVGLALLAPLLAVVALVVRLSSPGPAVYRQQRVGRNGRPFTIWKFRSMVADADRSGAAVSGREDDRVTRVGRWLRATHVDELPQLVNVLRGDMTLVGPRPEVPRFVAHYTARERVVLGVRPGIVGPGAILFVTAQAGELDTADDADRWYVEHHLHAKLALDLAYLRDRRLRQDLELALLATRSSPPTAPGAAAPDGRRTAEPRPAVPEALRVGGTAVAAVAALGFAALAIRYRAGSRPGALDAQLMGRLGSALRAYHRVVDVVVHLGDPLPVLLIALVLAAFAARARNARLVVLAVLAPLLTGLLTTAAKVLVGRTLDGDLSLPSGHTAAVTCLAVVGALVHLSRRHRAPVAPAADLLLVTVLAAVTGAALVGARVHYATDTIAGYCAALATTLALARLLDALGERRARRLAARAGVEAVTSTSPAPSGGARRTT